MASPRPGPRSRAGSGDTTQAKRSGAYMETSTEDFPPHLSRRARKEAESARMAALGIPRLRGPTKIPQTSVQRPLTQNQPQWPTLDHQARSSESSRSHGSGKASPKTTGSSSTASSGSQDLSKQPRNVLRRKHSSAKQGTARLWGDTRSDPLKTDSSSSIPKFQPSLDVSSGASLDRGLTEGTAEIRMAKRVELPTTLAQTVTIYPELDRYRHFTPLDEPSSHHFEVPYPITTDLPPPTPLFSGASSQVSGMSGSPSTRFSESPGPGPYSRDTTPTSMSSQSPGLVAPMRSSVQRTKQGSPAHSRPPVARRRAGSVPKEVNSARTDLQGLAAVRESLNSSSSNSTVRDGDKMEKKKKPLSPLPPSPPPRKSSQKFKKNQNEESSPSRPARDPAQPVMNVASPVKSAFTPAAGRDLPSAATVKAVPPARPSRDGTPDLQSQLRVPFPVIHSNLSATSISERRQSNLLAPSALPRSATPPLNGRQTQTQTRTMLLRGREATPAPHATTSQQVSQPSKSDTRKGTRTPSPNVASTFRTRFPIFGRRNKNVSDAQTPPTEKKDRPSRKGPAAGTGHEGYGRLGQVRRRSGSVTNGPRAIPGTMSSQESLTSNSSHDPFLAERMNPVVIAGGEIIENRNASSELTRTDSNQSLVLPRPSLGSRNSSQVSLGSLGPRDTLWPSMLPQGPAQTLSLGKRPPSDSSDPEMLAVKPTLAFRRSVQRLQTANPSPLQLPKPINVRPIVASPAVTSHDSSVLSDDSACNPRLGVTRDLAGDGAGPKKLTKKVKPTRKWNIFGRSQSQPATAKKQPEAPKVAATVKVVQHKPVAFYTMMDSPEQEDADLVDVEHVLREAQVMRNPSPSPQIPSRSGRRPLFTSNTPQEAADRPRRVGQAEAPQEPPTLPEVDSRAGPSRNLVQPSQSQQPSSDNPPSLSKPTAGRPSRLPQVGRIPQVATTRPAPMSPKSFSRPFQRASMQFPSPRAQRLDDEQAANSSTPPKPLSPLESNREGSATLTTDGSNPPSRLRFSRDLSSDGSRTQNEFLRFSPRKDSQGASTASSMSGILSFSDATAVIPEPDAPLAEDEVWDEYNDLLGDDGLKVPPSAGSSQGRPFHLEVWGKQLTKENGQFLESPPAEAHCDTDCDTEFEAEPQVEPAPSVSSSVYSSDMTARINEVLEAAGGPPSPFSVAGFITGYGDRDDRPSTIQPPDQRDTKSPSLKEPEARQSAASSSQCSEDSSSPLSQVNLRVGSMTVSKWLTFGHVMFSPVRDELVPVVGSLKRHSILVIDGLGNDDWSFYAAETYPAATFFNLSPRAPVPTDHQSGSSFPLSPPNHHQIQYNSHIDKFPFGPQSFTSVVYRFPAAAPESHYRNIVTEARRVLKPGGYLELSILDVDLNNVGTHGRRAMRRLKERISIRSPDISLGSAADLILRLLGRIGFTDVKSCRVGVPVATSSSERSMSSGLEPSRTGKGGPRQKGKRDTRSLAEMMTDQSPVADEGITKMVSKVGRWWYDRCYESAVMDTAPGGRSSMWNDRALLAECEEWRTSLKLMVCHARVPEINRVASI